MILGKDIFLPENTETNDVSDGYHTFRELYDHRISLFLSMMRLASNAGLDAGWSRNHDDGEPCFGGGWCIGWITAPSGKQARYHFEDNRPQLKKMTDLESEKGSPWNGAEETIDALNELALN